MVGQTEDNINNIDTHVPSTSFMSYLSSTVGVLFTFTTSSFGFSLGFALPNSGMLVGIVGWSDLMMCGGRVGGVCITGTEVTATGPARSVSGGC